MQEKGVLCTEQEGEAGHQRTVQETWENQVGHAVCRKSQFDVMELHE